MAIANNSSITLGASEPKKDAVVAVGVPTVAAGDVAIWAAADVPENLPQTTIGAFHALFRYAKTNIKDLTGTPAIVHMPFDGLASEIELNGTPTTDEVRLHIGADIHGGDKSHFMHRTFIRLIERWLEEDK